MKASCIRPDIFLETLKSKGFNLNGIIDETTRMSWNNDAVKRTLIEHLKIVFSISNLNIEEVFILINLSVLPSIFLKKINVKEMIKLENLNSLNSLVEKGWLSEYNDEIKIHNIIQEAIRGQVNISSGNLENLINSVIFLLNCSPIENPFRKIQYINYGIYLEKHYSWEDSFLGTLLNNIGISYRLLGEYEKAVNYLERAIKIHKKIESDLSNKKIAISYNGLGTTLRFCGRLDEAIDCFLYSLTYFNEVIKDKELLAVTYNQLSFVYLERKNNGDMENALNYTKKSLEIREDIYLGGHPYLATSYENIGCIYDEYFCDFSSGLEYKLKALEIRKRFLEKNHPDFIACYGNLSNSYDKLGNLFYALLYSKREVKLAEKLLGECHPEIVRTYNRFAGICQKINRLDIAEEYFKKSIKICEKDKKNSSYDLGALYSNLGCLYDDFEKDKSFEYYTKGFNLLSSLKSQENIHLANIYNNIGCFFIDKNFDKAKFSLEKSIEIYKNCLGNNHISLALAYSNIGNFYKIQNHSKNAIYNYTLSLKIYEKFDNEHLQKAYIFKNMGDILIQQNEFKKARKMFIKASIIFGMDIANKFIEKVYCDNKIREIETFKK